MSLPSNIPREYFVNVNYSDVQSEHDFISLTPLEWIQYPICRTAGMVGVTGGFVDVRNLAMSMRRNPMDPMTRGPLNLNDYKVVVWQNLPERHNRLYNPVATYHELELLKRGGGFLTRGLEDVRVEIPENMAPLRNYTARFRDMMAQMTLLPHDEVPWLFDYWKNHPFDSTIDTVRPRDDFVDIQENHPPTRHRELVSFRCNMIRLLYLHSTRLIRNYWNAHPRRRENDDDADLGIFIAQIR